MDHLRISYDQGSSLVKALYQVNKRLGFITMQPEILSLPVSSIEARRERAPSLNASFPEDDAWLSYKKRSDNCFVLGHLAKQFHGSAKLNQLKFEQGAAKLMAIIGAIIQKEGLSSDVEVDIAALLPFGEYANRQRFMDKVTSEAKNYYFRNQKINVAIETFACIPEGGGFITHLIDEHGKEWLAQHKIVIIMCGHRNTSLLVFEKGSLSDKSQTTNLGFIRLVESVIQKTSLDNVEAVTKAIYAIGNQIDAANDDLRVLVKSYEADNFEHEAQQIAEAIKSARQEYWILIRDWLQANLSNEDDVAEMIIAGGAAEYFKAELDKFLNWAEPSWNVSGNSEVLNSIFADSIDQESLVVRFKDVYALHLSLYRQPLNV